jgi:hypothetical protein
MTLQGALQLLKKLAIEKMRKTILRRLEALEQEHRSREQEEVSPFAGACACLWHIVFAYYLGDLKSDEKNPDEATARAFRYQSHKDCFNIAVKAILNDRKALSEITQREHDVIRRLFAKRGLDFDSSPLSALFDAFVTVVNELPDQWSNWLRSELRKLCPEVELANGSNIPCGLSVDNFLS